MTASPRTVCFVSADPATPLPWIADEAPFRVERVGAHPTATEAVEAIARTQPMAVCLAADVDERLALEIARLLDERHPHISVVLWRVATPALWQAAARVGVRDIVAPTSDPHELTAALVGGLDRSERRSSNLGAIAPSPGRHGRVVVVLSPKGGSGKTMVATNLAVSLAASNTGDTVLVDLDCVFGDVATVLGLVPDHTAGQLTALSSFDTTTLKMFLTRHDPSGLYVLAGSGTPEEGEALTDALVAQIIQMLARDFTYVVIDTAAGLDERALAAIEHSTDCVLMASMDVASIRSLAKEITALDRLGMVTQRRHFLLNRADARVGLEVGDVESAIGMKVDAALPSSRLVPLSMNRGHAVVLDEPESEVGQHILSFAQRFTPRPDDPIVLPGDRKQFFSLRRR